MKQRSGSKDVPSVAARFDDVADVVRFLGQLGMPASLVNQLSTWLRGLEPGEAEEMEPELMWEGRPARVQLSAVVDDNDTANVEFKGPATLIAEIQDELDAFFGTRDGSFKGKQQEPHDKRGGGGGDGRKRQGK